jgi:Subtilase family
LIEQIRPAEPIRAPEISQITPPSPLMLRPAYHANNRLIIQFANHVRLPELDEIICDKDSLSGMFPERLAFELVIKKDTAWLCRVFPGGLGKKLDQLSKTKDTNGQAPNFARYFYFRLSGEKRIRRILDLLLNCDSISTAYEEVEFSSLQSNSPQRTFQGQDNLESAPRGISLGAAWGRGSKGAGISVAIVELGWPPNNHQDFAFKKILGKGVTSSTHAIEVTGVIASKDNNSGIVGVSPESEFIYVGYDQLSTAGATSITGLRAALGNLKASNELQSGSVINISIGANIDLDEVNFPAKESSSYNATGEPLLRKTILGGRSGSVPFDLVKSRNPNGGSNVKMQLPIEHDELVYKLLVEFISNGVSVCIAAGNTYLAKYQPRNGGAPIFIQAGSKVDVTGPWADRNWGKVRHTFKRGDPSFIDSGAIVVTGTNYNVSKSTYDLGLNLGNRVDCFAQSPVRTWIDRSNLADISGSSIAAPAVAGVAAVIQSFMKQKYGRTLKPRWLRALISDPQLNTLADGDTLTHLNKQVGVMPDLDKILSLLETKGSNTVALRIWLEFAKVSLRDQLASAGFQTAEDPHSDTWDPYRIWDVEKKKWQSLQCKVDDDVFN